MAHLKKLQCMFTMINEVSYKKLNVMQNNSTGNK